jgi:FLYWCH zinc finger domain
MCSALEYGISKRGERTLIYQNFEYWRIKDNAKGHIFWRCSLHQRFECKARLKTDNNRVIGNQTPKHTHSDNVAHDLAIDAKVCSTASMLPINNIEHTNNHVGRRLNRHPSKEMDWTTFGIQSPYTDNFATNLARDAIICSTDSMIHENKLAHVDPKMFTPFMRGKNLTGIDSEIEATLISDLPDDEKVKRYAAILKRFKAFEEPTIEKTPAIDQLDSNVIHPVLPNQTYEDKRLIQRNKREPDISWARESELINNQTKIQNSSIVDLMSDAIKNKSTDFPNGCEEFSNYLRKALQKLIANTERRKNNRGPTTTKRKHKKQQWIKY